jgi:hypothetical protein
VELARSASGAAGPVSAIRETSNGAPNVSPLTALEIRCPEARSRFPGGREAVNASSLPLERWTTPKGFVGGPVAQDDWDKFDVPGLRGVSKTAPYFRNNSAATLEDMVDHYIEHFRRAEALFAYLRKP